MKLGGSRQATGRSSLNTHGAAGSLPHSAKDATVMFWFALLRFALRWSPLLCFALHRVALRALRCIA